MKKIDRMCFSTDLYKEFKRGLKKIEGNFVDNFVKAESYFKERIKLATEQKKELDAIIKGNKTCIENMRKNTMQFFQEKKFSKLNGIKSKSITYYPQSTEEKLELEKNISINGDLKNINEITKEELVEELQRLGAELEVKEKKVKVEKDACIRVMH